MIDIQTPKIFALQTIRKNCSKGYADIAKIITASVMKPDHTKYLGPG